MIPLKLVATINGSLKVLLTFNDIIDARYILALLYKVPWISLLVVFTKSTITMSENGYFITVDISMSDFNRVS